MATNREEQLSIFFDGELDSKQSEHVVSQLCSDPIFQRHWDRYNLISDAMKNTLPPILRKDFSASVKQAIENEPAILSPQHSQSHIVQQDNHSQFTKRIASFAIAASVATLAVIGVYMQHSEVENTQQIATMPSGEQYVRLPKQSTNVASSEMLQSQHRNVLSASSTFSFPGMQATDKITTVAGPVITSEPAPQILSDAQFNDHIHKYLVNHNQHVSGTRIQGLIPYARIISTPTENMHQAQQ